MRARLVDCARIRCRKRRNQSWYARTPTSLAADWTHAFDGAAWVGMHRWTLGIVRLRMARTLFGYPNQYGKGDRNTQNRIVCPLRSVEDTSSSGQFGTLLVPLRERVDIGRSPPQQSLTCLVSDLSSWLLVLCAVHWIGFVGERSVLLSVHYT